MPWGHGVAAVVRSRLAVLDKYAHVLSEYNDNELHGEGALSAGFGYGWSCISGMRVAKNFNRLPSTPYMSRGHLKAVCGRAGNPLSLSLSLYHIIYNQSYKSTKGL